MPAVALGLHGRKESVFGKLQLGPCVQQDCGERCPEHADPHGHLPRRLLALVEDLGIRWVQGDGDEGMLTAALGPLPSACCRGRDKALMFVLNEHFAMTLHKDRAGLRSINSRTVLTG